MTSCNPKTLHALPARTVHWHSEITLQINRNKDRCLHESSQPIKLYSTNFERSAANTFFYHVQTISWWRIFKGGGGVDQHPESICSSGMNSDLGEWFFWRSAQASGCRLMHTLNGSSSSDHIDWPLTKGMFTFVNACKWSSEPAARAWTFLKAVSVLSRSAEGECVCHGRPAELHAHYVLLVATSTIVHRWICSSPKFVQFKMHSWFVNKIISRGEKTILNLEVYPEPCSTCLAGFTGLPSYSCMISYFRLSPSCQ